MINNKLPLIGLLSENTPLKLPLQLPELETHTTSKGDIPAKLDLAAMASGQLVIGKLGICNTGTNLKSISRTERERL